MSSSNLNVITVIVHNEGRGEITSSTNSDPLEDFFFAGEQFHTSQSELEWIGFYDWLRGGNGDVIGVRLSVDEPSKIDNAVWKRMISASPENSKNLVTIFFERDVHYDPLLSDDADFGGNAIFEGNLGSIAITFNAPPRRT
jgi:hypothetical protein